LVEYGFAVPENKYDFFRVSDTDIKTFFSSEHPEYQTRLEKLNLKTKIRADLKEMGLHRDVLKMIRCNHDGTEIDTIHIYRNWILSLMNQF
jgi:hypothetical protein